MSKTVSSVHTPLVYLVEDDPNLAKLERMMLLELGYDVQTFTSGEDVLKALEDGGMPSTMLLDMILPGMNGREILAKSREIDSTLPIIIVSAQEDVSTAVSVLREGAYDYLVKPVQEPNLDKALRNAVEQRKVSLELRQLRKEVAQTYSFDRLVGASRPMRSVFRLLEKTLHNDLTVLILGESGTGKELVARAVHYNGLRSDKPFIVVNCAAIPNELVESELFGHEKGSFTGAIQRKEGKFELADGGTLFLDEIGDLDTGVQAKLLRALQESEFERVGGTKTIEVNVRVIAATKRNLDEDVKSGRFREDLFYRISTFPVTLPPLRDRKEDIDLLARFFLDKHAATLGREDIKGFSSEAMEALNEYDWPGNVRQLENVINRAIVLADKEWIQRRDLAREIVGDMAEEDDSLEAYGDLANVTMQSEPQNIPLSQGFALPAMRGPDDIMTLEDVKAWAVGEAYRACKGNISHAAKKLALGRATFYRLLEKYNIPTSES